MTKDNYVQKEDGTFVCKTCDSTILEGRVAHPIWLSDGPGPCAGTGRCEYEIVPYCPHCESKPDFHGKPIYKSVLEALAHGLY